MKKLRWLLATLTALTMFAAGCGDDDETVTLTFGAVPAENGKRLQSSAFGEAVGRIRQETVDQSVAPVFGEIDNAGHRIGGSRLMAEAPHIGERHRRDRRT